jgi:TetR/AcrR family transcriptional regulator, cholesterol catabolism regulator
MIEDDGLLDTKARSNTRDRLIEAAVELFGANGFNETSMRDLAAEVGIKAPALYNHFRSKEEIFVGAITVTLRDFHAAVAGADDPSLPALERLDGLVTRHVIYQIDHARTAKANDRMIESSALERLSPVQREAVRTLLRAYLDTMTSICEAVVREAGRDTKDVRLTALALGSMCDKVLSWYRPDGKYPKQKIAAHFCRLARNMLLAPSE